MKPRLLVSLMVAFVTLPLSPAALNSRPAQVRRREPKLPSNPAMNQLIRLIHYDIKQLRGQYPWLASYNDRNLGTSNGNTSIYYFARPKYAPGVTQPQQPPHLTILYLPTSIHSGFKYQNDLEGEKLCHFSSYHIKLGAQLMVPRDVDRAIRKCIRQRCLNLRSQLIKQRQAAK